MTKKLYLWILLSIVWFADGGDVLAQQADHLQSLALEPQTGILIMGTNHGLYESRDEGKSWNKRVLRGDAPGKDFMRLAVDPSHPNVIYAAGQDLAVVKSEDGGVTWRREAKGLPTPDIRALALDPTKPERLHVWAPGQGLYRSEDGAKHWGRIDNGPRNREVISLTSVPIPTGMGGIFLYASTASGLFRSPDCF